jgi:protein-S-isoprenylcysteine O-methyltransferase Ste14
VLFWVWLAVLVRRCDLVIGIPFPSWLRPIGSVVALAGALLASSCVIAFVTEGRGTPAPFDPPREFVGNGPYRFARNPMYIGGIAVLAGAGLALASLTILLLAVFALIASHLFVVFYEEPALTQRFGDSYLRYKAAVNRWLIHLPKQSTRPRLG